MKKLTAILLVFTLAVFVYNSFASTTGDKVPNSVTLSGKVIDKSTQETLTGALVRIEGTDLEAYTDFDGNFTITGILPDTYKVKCSMISYRDREEEIKIDQNSGEVQITLENIVVE